LYNDAETYRLLEGEVFTHMVHTPQHGESTNAYIKFEYGTYMKSNEPICFTGDFFAYPSPSCGFREHRMPVSTSIHNPH